VASTSRWQAAALPPWSAASRLTPAGIIDARGHLVSPPFVDAHFHLDATFSLGMPRLNRSGTLIEGIALRGELKPLLTHEAHKLTRESPRQGGAGRTRTLKPLGCQICGRPVVTAPTQIACHCPSTFRENQVIGS
jgi:hypothetical protein